jgi:hypothetical protein
MREAEKGLLSQQLDNQNLRKQVATLKETRASDAHQRSQRDQKAA